MVSSPVTQPGAQVHRIGTEFRNAASKLFPGILVKDEHFTLFEAVSALEIGDPKMDSGCSAFDPEGEEEFDPAKPTSAEEIIWLMDELMYREVAWHMGYPLSQTLFTSIHIERLLWPEPKILTDATFLRRGTDSGPAPSLLTHVLQPYCIGLIKCCDLVHSMVTSQHYYEEEDFASHIFNRPLLHDFPVEQIMAHLHIAKTALTNLDLPSELIRALESRIGARSALLQLFDACSHVESMSFPSFEAHLTSIRNTEDSAHLGIPTTSASFTLKIQRLLASNVPPRPMILIPKVQAFQFMRQLVTDSRTAFQILNVSSSTDLLSAYQHSMAQEPQPAVYVRALAQSFLDIKSNVLGRFSGRDFVVHDICSLVKPNGLSLSHDQVNAISEDQEFELESRIERFVGRCGRSFVNLFRTLCLNRCRVRRTMCHAALEWDQIQVEAEELDTVAQSILDEPAAPFPAGEEPTYAYTFSSWAYHYKLFQLETILQTGFELSIYASHEIASMYWYLSFLIGTHLNHLERISFFVASRHSSIPDEQPEVQQTLKLLYRCFIRLKATEAMAKALHRVFMVLQRQGHFPIPAGAYGLDALRYDLRMRPFLHLSIPEPIDSDIARQSSSLQGLSDESMLEQASQLIQTARKAWEEVLQMGWHFNPLQLTVREAAGKASDLSAEEVIEREWAQDVRNSMRTCIGTGIVITVLTMHLRSNVPTASAALSKLLIDIPVVGSRDRWHRSWPVPKLQA